MLALWIVLFVIGAFELGANAGWYVICGDQWNWRVLLVAPDPYLNWRYGK